MDKDFSFPGAKNTTAQTNAFIGVQADGNAPASNSISLPQITLPKGGGALKSIDEKFTVNAANGTASFSIAVPITPGRNNFHPSLAIGYNSGAGNSAFGLGWNLDVPSIQRKTDKSLPRYQDGVEKDTFLFAGAEDLVPVLVEENGEWQQETKKVDGFTVTSYHPRIEGLFARIERIKPDASNAFYWRITTKENVVTFFGRSETHRIADPDDAAKIFKWLPELSFDDKGNCILFEYKSENLAGVINALHEKNRFSGQAKFTNKYLKRISYGNIQPFYPDYGQPGQIHNTTAPVNTDYLFEVVFDFGEHTNDLTTEATTWPARVDPFSEYRSSFEIRTYRLCRRVMMFHHFTKAEFELTDANAGDAQTRIPYLVRSLDFAYEPSSNDSSSTELNYLKSIRQTGYKKEGDNYSKQSLPPVEFRYQPLQWNTEIKTVTKEDAVNEPAVVTSNSQWIDFFGEGIAGVLTEQADAWYYKANLGEGALAEAKEVIPKPSFIGLSTGVLQVQDLDANGRREVVWMNNFAPGYFALIDDNEWISFQTIEARANVNLRDPNLRYLDLNGDGRPEIVISEEAAFAWYPSKGSKGYDSKETTLKPFDEEEGPAIVFANNEESIFLADMNGDGLTDIVRIRNGEVSYWPNRGYGKFGAKVAMSNAPRFDHSDVFNPAYLRLADVSGTGASDILYLGKTQFTAWLNLSGNAWSEPKTIDGFPSTAFPNQVSVTDLLGTGTACLVWSSPLPGDSKKGMQYLDLMGGKKPHLLLSYKNNFGKETVLEYKSSAHYYLADKKEGKPWITKLPFPVQCVSKVEVIDRVTDLRFTNKYQYHHGFYDSEEREFRGFGMVEQTDTEEYQYLKNKQAANAVDIELHEPPTLIKTWFHTGAFLRREKILNHYLDEYWFNQKEVKENFGNEIVAEFSLPDAVLPDDLTSDEIAEAHRACKGTMLRQEVFSLDGMEKEKLPYSVASRNCVIKKLQPKQNNRHAVFLVHQSEAASFSYERNVTDSRISHTLNLEVDNMGNVLKAASIVYPRKVKPADLETVVFNEQAKLHIILSNNRFTDDVFTPSVYRLRLPWETKTFEAAGIAPDAAKGFFTADKLNVDLTEIGYEKSFTGAAEKRLINHTKTIYHSNDLKTKMPEGKHDSLGLVFESYQLAFTPSLLDAIYKKGAEPSKVNDAMLLEANYVQLADNNFWIRSGTVQYTQGAETATAAAVRFYTPLSYMDSCGSITSVSYYSNYFLLVQQVKDALDNTTKINAFDFRTLSPKQIQDANGNKTAVVFDKLGMVVGLALMGKATEADNLQSFEADLSQAQIDAFLNNPLTEGGSLLKGATSRIVYDFSKIPCVTATIRREEHQAVNPLSRLQYSFEYSDGTGHVVLAKGMVEPGDAPHRDADGNLVKNPDGSLHLQPTTHRWIGSGRTILNNKGAPVKQYEPYFSDSHLYETEPELREAGVTSVLHYDAAGRLVKTIFPHDTFSKIEYNQWWQKNYDACDTVTESKWFTDRINNLLDAVFIKEGKDPQKEKEAAQGAAIHDNTPSLTHFDSLGRPFYTIAHNRFKDFTTAAMKEEFYATQTTLDIEGAVRAVTDAAGNVVMQYSYDMLGRQVYHNSMDAGERWLLNDCANKPKFKWDSKDQQFIVTYDELQRPLMVTLKKGADTIVTERFEYVDTKGLTPAQLQQQQASNLIGKEVAHYDGAGILRLLKCDFKANPEETSQQFCTDYKTTPNWQTTALVPMEQDVFTTVNKHDALNRLVRTETPHTATIPASVVTPQYNETGLLNAVSANLRGSNASTTFVQNIDYDAKGQRTSILYGNNTVTKYTYDEKTFRLIRLLTTANAGNTVLQDIRYTYDPTGNVTHTEDKAAEPIFFNGARVEPLSEFIYDAVYRLVQATGREHAGQNRVNETATNSNTRNFPFENVPDFNDVQAVRKYTQQYTYDATGNMRQLQHIAGAGSYTRTYQYNNNDADRTALNVNVAVRKNNQLLATTVGAAAPIHYNYDAHGNLLDLPHLQTMQWDHKDRLQSVDLGGGGKAFYVYDSNGDRIRKVIERAGGIKEERIYLPCFEWFRQTNDAAVVQEATETLHIMDDKRRIALVETKTIKNSAPLSEENPERLLIRYQYNNHLGSSSMELNHEGTVISYEEYHPYGTTSYQATNAGIKAAAKRYRFIGMERDEESGLNYHGARYYAHWLCRWITADPAGISDGLNLYAYARENPVLYFDTEGKANQSIHDDLTRIIASQYVDKETSIAIGRAANRPDTEKTLDSEYNSKRGDPDKVNQNIHVLVSDDPKSTIKRTMEAYRRRDTSGKSASQRIEEGGIHLLHPVQDASYHLPDVTDGPGFGHFLFTEADLAVGNKSFDEFYDVVKNTESGIELMKEKGDIGESTPMRKKLSKDEWKGVYGDLKAIEEKYKDKMVELNIIGFVGTVAGKISSVFGAIIGGVIGGLVGFVAALLSRKNVWDGLQQGIRMGSNIGSLLGVPVAVLLGFGTTIMKDDLRTRAANEQSNYLQKRFNITDREDKGYEVKPLEQMRYDFVLQ